MTIILSIILVLVTLSIAPAALFALKPVIAGFYRWVFDVANAGLPLDLNDIGSMLICLAVELFLVIIFAWWINRLNPVTAFRYTHELRLLRKSKVGDDPKTFYIDEDYAIQYDHGQESKAIIVHKSETTDFASIPRCLCMFFSKIDSHLEASVVHDHCYRTNCLSREISDWVFLAGMKEAKVNVFSRTLMFVGVRLGGWLPYGKNGRAPNAGSANGV